MKKGEKIFLSWNNSKIFLFLFLLIFLSTYFVLASFQYYDHNIQTNYLSGDKIKGKFNISFSEQNPESKLTSNLQGEISLKEFLDLNFANYNCSPQDCKKIFHSSGNPIVELSILNSGYFGFKVTGSQIDQISSVKFNLQSDAGNSCNNQISLDFLNLGDKIMINSEYINETCINKPKNYGCFNSGLSSYDLAEINLNNYCNKINLTIAPAYLVGAKIKNKTSGPGGVEMSIYNLEGGQVGKCKLPTNSEETQELNCVIPKQINSEAEYSVCVKSTHSGSNYKINSEAIQPICGSSSSGDHIERDYEIFAQPLSFGQVNIFVNDTIFNSIHGQTLSSYFTDYIQDKFSGNCSSGCFIPIKVEGSSQNIIFSNAEIKYIQSGTILSNNEIYLLSEQNAKMNSGNLTLEMEKANFTIPFGQNPTIFQFRIDGSTVFNTPISVTQSFDFDITPKFALFGKASVFAINTAYNITSATWNFGDGTIKTTQSKTISHTYSEQKTFNVEVRIIRADGATAKKTFSVQVGNPKEAANKTIEEYTKNLQTLSLQINSYPQWIKSEIEKKIDPANLGYKLNQIKGLYAVSINDEDFQKVMTDLIELNIPRSINKTAEGRIPTISSFSKMDVSYIQELSPAMTTEDFRSKISLWMTDKLSSEIIFEEISAIHEASFQPLITTFRVDSRPKENIPYEYYLLMSHPLFGVTFKSQYGQTSVKSGTAIKISPGDSLTSYEFIIPAKISPTDLGIYLSPSLDKLSIESDLAICNLNKKCERARGENRGNCPNDCRPWGWFFVWILVILIVALIVYIFLQEWYKKNYEKSLFPNENDLYNLINFIYNARVAGLTNSQIRKKLSGAGWSSERIEYALRKIDGKRTGMYEIPIFKILENNKVKRELEVRQSKPIDARFIKRPDFR